MALKIIDALKSDFPHDGSFGRAHLIFDRDIEADPLRVSLKRLDDQEYLGESFPPKANWTRTRSHFFNATLVARGDGQTVYMLGPEVSTFVPEWTRLEVASEDNSIREIAEWTEVSLDFIWQPPAQPLPLWKASVPLGAPVGPPTRKPEQAGPTPTQVGQTAGQQGPSDRPPPDPPKPEPPKSEPVAATTTTSDLPKADEPPSSPPPDRRKPVNWGVWAVLLTAVAAVLVAVAIYAVYWGTQNRDTLCSRFHMFCDAEEVAFRDAQSCAASKTCGASECVVRYRDAYPNGRFRSQIDDIAVSKGRPCNVENPKPDPEKLAYDRVVACAASRTCGASACVIEYRQSFPGGAHKADVDRIVAQKGGECVTAAEKEVYDQAVGCARPRTCGALECVAEYRRRYPGGNYKAQIDQIAQAQNARACPDPVEEDVFERATGCARPKSCGAAECLGEYRRRYPNGRHKAEIDQIAQSPKGQACPDLDKEAYDRADRCAAPLRCGADHCLIEYKRDFANGKYRPKIDEIAAQKGAVCGPSPSPTPSVSPSADLPPLVPRRSGDDPEFNCGRSGLEPIEQMICKDSDMARANGELQRLFNQLIKPLRGTPNERPFRDRETDWVHERDKQCNIPGSGSWNDTDLRRLKNCFVDKTRARINDLRPQ